MRWSMAEPGPMISPIACLLFCLFFPVYRMLLILLMLLLIFQMQSLGKSDVTCFYRERCACVVT